MEGSEGLVGPPHTRTRDMSIIVSDNQTEFTPHPEGQFASVCMDVIDHGWLQTDFGHKHKVTIVFFAGQYDGTKDLSVRRRFTASLHEKSNLRPFLEAWRGRPFTIEELGRFDLEHLLRAGALLQVVHAKTERGVFANISSVMRLPHGVSAPAIPADYVRVCDRPDWQGPAPQPGMSEAMDQQAAAAPDDDDLPF